MVGEWYQEKKIGQPPVLAQKLRRVSRTTQTELEAEVVSPTGGLEWPPLLKRKEDKIF